MTSSGSPDNPASPSLQDIAAPARGCWRPVLRSRLVGRAEPLYVGVDGLRSAASIWSGALVWAGLLRTRSDAVPVVVGQIGRLALLQLLVAVLWDGRTLRIEPGASVPRSGAWHLTDRCVMHDGRPVCPLGEGGWPDLAGPGQMSTLEMVDYAPAEGEVVVAGLSAQHGRLWLELGVPGIQPDRTRGPEPAPGSETLPPFDLKSLASPAAVLGDALLPLLRSAEVWERAALPEA